MRLYLFIFFSLIFKCFIVSGQSHLSSKDITQKVINQYKIYQSVSYDYHLKMKFFDSEEPFTLDSHVDLIRDESDSTYRGNFLYDRIDSVNNFHRYFDGKYLYLLNHVDRKITRFDKDFPISGSVDSYTLNTAFLNISVFEASLKNSKNTVSYQDSTMNGVTYAVVKVYFPNEGDYIDKCKTYWMNRKTLVIEKSSFSARYFEQVQMVEWRVKNVKFNIYSNVKLKHLINPYFKKYSIEIYKPPIQESLQIGDIFPEISGTLYPDSVALVNMNKKFRIIDFWYASCDPCIKSIPFLNEIAKQFSESVQVVGLNPIDIEADSYKKIAALLKRTPIFYEIVQIKRDFNDKVKVRYFPTLFLINADSKIIYIKEGYEEEGFKELKNVIEANLRQEK